MKNKNGKVCFRTLSRFYVISYEFLSNESFYDRNYYVTANYGGKCIEFQEYQQATTDCQKYELPAIIFPLQILEFQ